MLWQPWGVASTGSRLERETDPAEEPDTQITVFLLDDHEIVRRGVAGLVDAEPDMHVVGESGSAAEAVSLVLRLRPDVAVLDVRLEDGTGVEVCREIRSAVPTTACLMLTSYADDRALVDAAVAGAAGFVLKQVRGNQIVESIRKVASGAVLLDSATVRLGMERLKATEAGALEQLTPQERRIFDLIGEGLSNREIGERLYLAEKTVKNNVTNVLAKLGLHRRTEAAALAARVEERERHGYK